MPDQAKLFLVLNLVVNRGKTVLIADTAVNEWPSSEQLAEYCNIFI